MMEIGNRTTLATPGIALCICVLFMFYGPHTNAQAAKEYKDVVYATIDGTPLTMNIFVQGEGSRPSLFVWVHGGAWRSGSKESMPEAFKEAGFAVASLDFRLSTTAAFPAMIHDIKAAIRFLRANADRYGYKAERIAVGGSSSGGHLATLVGVTNGNKDLEGTLGTYSGTSSSVQAIVDFYGASNLTTILGQSTPHGLSVRKPALELLLGALPENNKPLAELASPVYHVDPTDPPLLIIHGDQDPQMPINQAHELEGKYSAMGLDVTFDVVHGGAHGGDAFYSGKHLQGMIDFLRRTIDIE
jgi:acetyl esterase/lipase